MEKKFQIGNLILKKPYFLAPMHGINDVAFRKLCKRAGCSLCYTELTNPQTKKPLNFEDKPAVQFICNQKNGIKEFIKKNDKNIQLYDLNLGCPSPHAKQSKTGYFMINNLKQIEEILKEIKKNTKKPITIKIRKMPFENVEKIIKIAEKYCDAIAIHPRTQKQGYSGEPDINYARKIKQITNLPVIYSGNINNKSQAEKMLNEFDFIMLGRAAIGSPSIFFEFSEKKLKKKIKFSDYLKLAKKYKFNFNQIKKQAMNFTKGDKNAAEKRNLLSKAKSEKEIIKIMKN